MPRKSESIIKKPNAHMPGELYTISYSTQFVRGASKEIRDDNGKLLYSARKMRTHIGGTYTKEQAETIVKAMRKDKLKNVEMKKGRWNLPSECPSCHNQGSPRIYPAKGTLRVNDSYNQKNRDELRLYYNHSNKKRKSCYIGSVVLDSPIPQIKLKRGLLIDSLGFRKRVGIYPL